MKHQDENQWNRFMKFINWYMSKGGHPLTPEEIERTVIKF